MKAVNEDLILIQDEIRESFGWGLDSDVESAELLVSKCKNSEPNLRFEDKVTVVGAAAEPGVKSQYPIVVADGAIGAIEDLSTVALIVTDGDGTPHIEKALNKGIPSCLHAHGDNVESWSKILSQINERQEVFLTHQTPREIDGMYNPGGFTDGDRAACFLTALGTRKENIKLLGTRSDIVGRWSGDTEESSKLQKLQWMKSILQIQGLWDG